MRESKTKKELTDDDVDDVDDAGVGGGWAVFLLLSSLPIKVEGWGGETNGGEPRKVRQEA